MTSSHPGAFQEPTRSFPIRTKSILITQEIPREFGALGGSGTGSKTNLTKNTPSTFITQEVARILGVLGLEPREETYIRGLTIKSLNVPPYQYVGSAV